MRHIANNDLEIYETYVFPSKGIAIYVKMLCYLKVYTTFSMLIRILNKLHLE